MVGLELCFLLIVALLEYSVACAIYTRASTAVIPIKHRVLLGTGRMPQVGVSKS